MFESALFSCEPRIYRKNGHNNKHNRSGNVDFLILYKNEYDSR